MSNDKYSTLKRDYRDFLYSTLEYIQTYGICDDETDRFENETYTRIKKLEDKENE